MTARNIPTKAAQLSLQVAKVIVATSLPEEELFLELNESDIIERLERNRDIRGLATDRVGGGSEFTGVEALAAIKILGTIWGTYKLVKDILLRVEEIKLKDPVAIAIWQERLEQSGVPKDLANRIATTHLNDFLHVMRDSE